MLTGPSFAYRATSEASSASESLWRPRAWYIVTRSIMRHTSLVCLGTAARCALRTRLLVAKTVHRHHRRRCRQPAVPQRQRRAAAAPWRPWRVDRKPLRSRRRSGDDQEHPDGTRRTCRDESRALQVPRDTIPRSETCRSGPTSNANSSRSSLINWGSNLSNFWDALPYFLNHRRRQVQQIDS